MSTRFNKSMDASLQLVEKIIDQSDGPIDERTYFLLDKMLSKGKGRDTIAPGAVSTAPEVPATPPVRGSNAGGLTSADSMIARLARARVRPGDLITASYMDGLVDALLELNRRLSALEDEAPRSPPVVVTSPPSSPPRTDPTVPPPVIVSAVATTRRGVGVQIDVAGNGMSQGLFQKAQMANKDIGAKDKNFEFTATGFRFITTLDVLKQSNNIIGVTTKGGQDTARIATENKDPIIKSAIASRAALGMRQITVVSQNITKENLTMVQVGTVTITSGVTFNSTGFSFGHGDRDFTTSNRMLTVITSEGTVQASIAAT